MTQPNADSRSAELLSIGSELLLGETVDTNVAFLGRELAGIGIRVAGAGMVADDRGRIRDAFRAAIGRGRLVIVTGGLGPTHDDLTREGLADALGEALVEDDALLAALEERFRAHGRMPESNRRQATLIPSATPLQNPIGSAPGWWAEHGDVVIVLMPGVPSEMRRMWVDEVRPRLERRLGRSALAIRTVKSFGVGESAVAERLGTILDSPPDGVDAGIYARDDGVHVRFSTSGPRTTLDEPVRGTLAELGEDAYGTDEATLPHVALARLASLGAATVASVESGTDGALIAVLAGAEAAAERARYVGGVFTVENGVTPPDVDIVVRMSLLPEDANGRSRVRVSADGTVYMAPTELRIHGSGPQRMRRAAYAALDAVRRL